MKVILLFFSFISSFYCYTYEAIKDKVTLLPFSLSFNFSLFSGYLNVNKQRKIHYIYTESQNNPLIDPLIIWTNGGPGCSGLTGFFTEMGPFRTRESDENKLYLIKNPFSWNLNANIVFLEQPVGVGFSYRGDPDDHEIFNDLSASKDHLEIIVKFFEKFPERKTNDLYFASESYGGHYTPQLTKQLFTSEYDSIKNQLKGIIIGNPWVSFGTGAAARGISFWGLQLIPRSLWIQYQANSCDNMDATIHNYTDTCWNIMGQMFHKISPHIDLYGPNFPICNDHSNITNDKSNNEEFDSKSWITPLKRFNSGKSFTREDVMRVHQKLLQFKFYNKQSLSMFSKTKNSQSNQFSHSRRVEESREWFDDDNEDKMGYVECSSRYMTEYLNLIEVKEALHVNPNITWSHCNMTMYEKWPTDDFYGNVIPLYKELVQMKSNLKILIFSGDNDITCPTVGTQHWIFQLGLETKSLWRPWFRRNQTAGYLTQFSNNFSFLTIHNAGHLVPLYQPGRGYEILPRYFDETWFTNIPEGIIFSTAYLITMNLYTSNLPNSNDEDIINQEYFFIKWALRYLFESELLKYDNKLLDIWNIEVQDINKMSNNKNNTNDDDNDDDDDSSSNSQLKTRNLKTKHQSHTIKSTTFFIIFEVLIPNYEDGIHLKTLFDIIFQTSFQTKKLQHILLYSYRQQLQFISIQNNIFFYQFLANFLHVTNAQVFSSYNLDLISLSKRPIDTSSKLYFNISWENFEKNIDLNGDNENNNNNNDNNNNNNNNSDEWYMHLLILTSKLDIGDIMILVFLPIGILFGVISIFQTYQSIHDKIFEDMGYEIQYDYSGLSYNGDEEQEHSSSASRSGIESSLSTNPSSTTVSPSSSSKRTTTKSLPKIGIKFNNNNNNDDDDEEEVIELSSYIKSSVY